MSDSAAAVEHKPYRSSSLPDIKLMMWIFLASDCMFFGTLIGTYLVYKGRSLEGPFPADVLDIPVTTVSSFVLLMSSFLMVLSLHALRENNIPRFRLWTFGVAFFGAIFLGFQVFEFSTFVLEGLTLDQNLFGSTFFVLTGTHGIHVTIGVLMLLSILITSYVKPNEQQGCHLPGGHRALLALRRHRVDRDLHGHLPRRVRLGLHRP